MFARKRGALIGSVYCFAAGVLVAQPGRFRRRAGRSAAGARRDCRPCVNGRRFRNGRLSRADAPAAERREFAKDVLNYSSITRSSINICFSSNPGAGQGHRGPRRQVKKEALGEKKDFKKLLEELFSRRRIAHGIGRGAALG